MKKIFAIISMLVFLAACGGTKVAGDRVEDPMKDLDKASRGIIEKGGLAAVGEGLSSRLNFAKDKALIDAQGKMAASIKVKVTALQEQFLEEVGQGEKAEVNELFSKAIRVFTGLELSGAVEKDDVIYHDKKNNQYTAGVLLVMEPKLLNSNLLQAMEKDPRDDAMYQRFRASETFKRLEKQEAKHEAQQTAN